MRDIRHILNNQVFSLFTVIIILALILVGCSREKNSFHINKLDYFEKRGLNVLVFSNWYNSLFGDSKISGIEIIHHEVRTATNGDVRFSPTPG